MYKCKSQAYSYTYSLTLLRPAGSKCPPTSYVLLKNKTLSLGTILKINAIIITKGNIIMCHGKFVYILLLQVQKNIRAPLLLYHYIPHITTVWRLLNLHGEERMKHSITPDKMYVHYKTNSFLNWYVGKHRRCWHHTPEESWFLMLSSQTPYCVSSHLYFFFPYFNSFSPLILFFSDAVFSRPLSLSCFLLSCFSFSIFSRSDLLFSSYSCLNVSHSIFSNSGISNAELFNAHGFPGKW